MTTCTCPDCGAHYSGSQRSGGHCRARYGGCCRTFANEASADKHRVGPMGFKTCITDLAAAGFRDTPRGWTIYPPMPNRVQWGLTWEVAK